MKPTLQLRLGQQLTMTPQLQQAIRLLQMPVLELNSQLEQALEENIMLEVEEPREQLPEDTGLEGESPHVASEEQPESALWSDIPTGGGRGDVWAQDDGRQADMADPAQGSLREHLLWQLEMEHFTPQEVRIGQTIIDYINEDGYLTETLEDIHQTLCVDAPVSLEEIETTLRKVQELDPVGVAARSLSECIRLQLLQLDEAVPGRDLALEITQSCLDLVGERQYSILRRRLGVSESDLETALVLVRSCHPRPGSAIQDSTAEYVVPDVYIRKQDDTWIVEVNRSIAPRLKVNQTYAEMLRGNGDHASLRTQLQEARWLVRSLEIRHDTLLKVAMCIVERQVDFLEHGEEAMKPMILRDIAEAVGMHESTISRVTSNKYMHTPRGIVEFRYFFSSQLKASDGTEQSSTSIRAKIRRLIAQEDSARPLSDSRVAALLKNEGIQIARRTVAKYRESMKIAPSNERKQ